MKSEFETWPATPVKSVARINAVTFWFAEPAEVASFLQTEQPGSAGHPAGCRFAIANCRLSKWHSTFNRQSTIGN